MHDDFIKITPSRTVRDVIRRTKIGLRHAMDGFYNAIADSKRNSERTIISADKYVSACKAQRSYYEECKRKVIEDNEKSEKDNDKIIKRMNDIEKE